LVVTVVVVALSAPAAAAATDPLDTNDDPTLATVLADAPQGIAVPCAMTDITSEELLERNRFIQFNTLLRHFLRAEMLPTDATACLQGLMGLIAWSDERPTDTYSGVVGGAYDVVCSTVKKLTGAEQCIPGTVEPFSAANDVSVGIPEAFYDSRLDRHYALARWEWNAQPDKNPGGDDGIAIAIEDVDSVREGYFYAQPNRGRDCNEGQSSQPSDRSFNYGLGFRQPDPFADFCGYRWDEGFISMSFEIDECRKYDIFAKLAHSYETTGVSGISIGAPASITITWAQEQFNWEAVSPDVNRYPPCDYGST